MADTQTPNTLCSDSDGEGYEESTLSFPILDASKLPHRDFSLPPRIFRKPLEFPKPNFDKLPSKEFMLPRELRVRAGLAENAEEEASVVDDFGEQAQQP